MITLKEASNLNVLAKDLAKTLSVVNQQSDPFLRNWVIVQNLESKEWLQNALSEQLGIAANLKFIFPSELVWQLFRLINAELPSKLPTDRIALEARIFDQLHISEEVLTNRGLDFPSKQSSILPLAVQIADVFDLYQTFRPKMLRKWESENYADDSWQAYLWKTIRNDIRQQYPELPGRADIIEIFEKQFAIKPDELPNQLFLFGLSHWSATFYEFIKLIATQIDVTWYDLNLIKSQSTDSKFFGWDTPKLDMKYLMKQDEVSTENLNNLNYSEDHLPQISIHSCHNLVREIQVLRNHLLHILENKKTVQSDDVLILVPDFEAYAPVIFSEFTGDNNKFHIPLSKPRINYQSDLLFIREVLQFYLENEKISSFLHLMNFQIMKDKFSISDHDIKMLSRCFSELKINGGLSSKSNFRSIENAINELVLGITMQTDDLKSVNKNVGFSILSNTDAREFISNLISVNEWLNDFKKHTNTEFSISSWLKHIQNWVTKLDVKSNQLFSSINSLIEFLELSNSEKKISYEEFYQWFIIHIADKSASSTKLGAGVTVSTYIPYRNIPFKIVAILGLNEGVFPRKHSRPDFDLISKYPKPGDRISHIDDKLLFYERLKSTEDTLYLSFIGEGASALLPSPLITELVDIFPQLSISRHSLHGFSEKEISQYPVYSSQDTTLLGLKSKHSEKFVEDTVEHILTNEVELKHLIEFFSKPSKYLLNNILGMKNVYEESYPDDRESLQIQGLDKYEIKKWIYELISNNVDADVETIKKFGTISGKIPRGTFAQKQFDSVFDGLERIRLLQSRIDLKNIETIDIDFELAETKINGSIHDVTNAFRSSFKITSIKPSDIISTWIQHLILSMISPEFKSSILYGLKDKEVEKVVFQKISKPEDYLEKLISIYLDKELQIEKCSSIPALSKVYVENNGSGILENALEKQWYSDEFNRKEDSDFYNRLLWAQSLPWDNDHFAELSNIIWSPILKYMNVESE